MHSFKEFGIKPQSKAFEGPKIEMDDILNKPIIVEDFKIEDSKFKEKGNGKRLTLQILVDTNKRIVFTGSVNLMQMIQEVKRDNFPFTTTIIKQNKRLEFT